MYATEQLVVPKSMAAMFFEGTRNFASDRGTRLATSQPFDVLRTSSIYRAAIIEEGFACSLRTRPIITV